ncbi:hypothetical protein V6N11_008577 [Hibiscus sabdariffa]|uniref:TBCC domain-containing protein 1 n=1 Tax=Hibiscus sabdariffa TaxID=183260 RepID=A0ABR2PPD3_9ROSI
MVLLLLCLLAINVIHVFGDFTWDLKVWGRVINCHDSVIYILAPLRFATVYGCSDATIVLGAVGKEVRIEHCERVHVIIAAKRVCIANCRECVFFLGVNQRPLIVGDNHKLQVAPYNTYYSQLEEHMTEVGIEATINRWDDTLALGMIDPHDSLSHPAGVSDSQAESATQLDPDQFTKFLIPNWFEGESTGSTKDNPFPLPGAYLLSQQINQKNLETGYRLLEIFVSCTAYKVTDVRIRIRIRTFIMVWYAAARLVSLSYIEERAVYGFLSVSSTILPVPSTLNRQLGNALCNVWNGPFF